MTRRLLIGRRWPASEISIMLLEMLVMKTLLREEMSARRGQCQRSILARGEKMIKTDLSLPIKAP